MAALALDQALAHAWHLKSKVLRALQRPADAKDALASFLAAAPATEPLRALALYEHLVLLCKLGPPPPRQTVAETRALVARIEADVATAEVQRAASSSVVPYPPSRLLVGARSRASVGERGMRRCQSHCPQAPSGGSVF